MTVGFAGTAAQVWEASAAWWREHGLVFPDPPAEVARDARGERFAGALAFPDVAAQAAQRDALAALGAYGQDAQVVADMLTADVDRPDGPYLLVLDDEMPPWSRGLTASGLRAALRDHDRVRLSVFEYLVVQRRAFEVFGDHRFDDYTGDPTGWSWLPASTAGALHAMAYYYGKADRVEISACKAGSKNPRKGAHVAQVVALTPAAAPPAARPTP